MPVKTVKSVAGAAAVTLANWNKVPFLYSFMILAPVALAAKDTWAISKYLPALPLGIVILELLVLLSWKPSVSNTSLLKVIAVAVALDID